MCADTTASPVPEESGVLEESFLICLDVSDAVISVPLASDDSKVAQGLHGEQPAF